MYLKDIIPERMFEDTDFDYKATLQDGNPMKWAKSIVAFANGDGGTIYVGVSDDWVAFGLSKREADEARLQAIRENDRSIFPHARLSFSFIEVPDRDERFVLAIYVHKSESILRYKAGDFAEKVFVRKDGASTEASPEEIVSMGVARHGFDTQLTDAVFSEADFSQYLELAVEYRVDQAAPSLNALISEEVVSESGNVTTGLSYFADGFKGDNSLISCRLWRGKSKGDDAVIDKKSFKGPLGEVFRFAQSFVKRNSRSGFVKLSDGRRKDTFSYPDIAVREALVNAIAHRDYSVSGTQIDVDIFSDRVQITSPGGWILGKRPEEYPFDRIPSKRRNPTIAAAFELAGLMERSGSGFGKISKAYQGYSQDLQPEIEDFGDYFCITLFDLLYEEEPRKEGEVPLREETVEELILRLCAEKPMSRKELMAAAGIASRTHFVSRYLKPLIDAGRIESVSPKNAPQQKYRLASRDGD